MSAADTQRRVSILHAIAGEVDRRTIAVDPAFLAQSDPERVRELVVSLGEVGACEDPGELTDALVAHAALVVAWVEIQAREMAA